MTSCTLSPVLRAPLLYTALLLAGCGGGGDTSPTPPPPAAVASVQVSPATATITVGETSQLQATVKDASGSTMSGKTPTWSSSADGVATVSTGGLVTAISAGSATITATVDGKSGSAAVTVTPVPVASVTVTPSASSVLAGATVQLAAATKDAGGNTLNGRTVTWSTSNGAVATVSPTGLVTTVAAGSVTITATAEAKNGAATVEVVNPLQIPTLIRPFALNGEYQTTNYFDHDIPKEFVDNNGTYLPWWGENSLVGIDGHSGYDWRMATGTPIVAAAAGTVAFAGNSASFFCPLLGANTSNPIVRIDHDLPGGVRIRTLYMHLSRIDVAGGQTVAAGQQIGLAGGVGCSQNPHLHFEVQRVTQVNGTTPAPIDPYGWEGGAIDPWRANGDGAESIKLWKDNEAPSLFRWVDLELNPGAGNLFVQITRVRYQGVRDATNPNNEYVDITRDNRFAPATLDLSGFTLRNKAGDTFTFPAGFTLTTDRTSVRVFTGTGTNTATELYWGQASGRWNNLSECVRFFNAANVLRNQTGWGGGCT